MPSVREALRAVGIELVGGAAWPRLGAEYAEPARRLRQLRARTIGLLPAADDVAVPAVAVHLGRALARVSTRPVGVVDALGIWMGGERRVAAAGAGARVPMVTSWLEERLAFLAPRAAGAQAATLVLREAIAGGAEAFDHLVFDLTGFDHLGEHLAASELLEAVVLVARSGRTRTRRIRRQLRDLPAGRCLGVFLTGT